MGEKLITFGYNSSLSIGHVSVQTSMVSMPVVYDSGLPFPRLSMPENTNDARPI